MGAEAPFYLLYNFRTLDLIRCIIYFSCRKRDYAEYGIHSDEQVHRKLRLGRARGLKGLVYSIQDSIRPCIALYLLSCLLCDFGGAVNSYLYNPADFIHLECVFQIAVLLPLHLNFVPREFLSITLTFLM
jgi:hypothetical protein